MPRQLPPVDDDVFEALQRLAEPLVDDANAVLRRLLELDASGEVANHRPASDTPDGEPAAGVGRPSAPRARRPPAKKRGGPQRKRSRAARGSLLPESEYELPLLKALVEAGGRGPAREMVEAVGADVADRLTKVDLECLDSGEVRWKSRVQFVRLKLIREGAMASDSPRGVWEITDVGVTRLERGRSD